MYQKTCRNCGVEFLTEHKNQQFCGLVCSGKFHAKARFEAERGKDTEYEWKREKDGKYACRYNPEGCACTRRTCGTCGHKSGGSKGTAGGDPQKAPGGASMRTDLYLEERKKGLTYREIAEKYGVSFQAVYCSCTRRDGTYYTVISEKGCIYPNLRVWLNEDKGRCDRFFEAMKGYSVREYLRGARQPKKEAIDQMLRLTGMTYEVMFAEEAV